MGTPGRCRGKVKWRTYAENSLSIPQNIHRRITMSAISLLGIYPKGLGAGTPTETGTLIVYLGYCNKNTIKWVASK